MTLEPNDPRLTAYVLGELDEAERAEVEAAIDGSPELRRAVDDIRRTSELVGESLQAEPALALTPEQRAAIQEEAAEPSAAPAVSATMVPTKRRRRRVILALAAAASLLLAVGLGVYSLPRHANWYAVTMWQPKPEPAVQYAVPRGEGGKYQDEPAEPDFLMPAEEPAPQALYDPYETAGPRVVTEPAEVGVDIGAMEGGPDPRQVGGRLIRSYGGSAGAGYSPPRSTPRPQPPAEPSSAGPRGEKLGNNPFGRRAVGGTAIDSDGVTYDADGGRFDDGDGSTFNRIAGPAGPTAEGRHVSGPDDASWDVDNDHDGTRPAGEDVPARYALAGPGVAQGEYSGTEARARGGEDAGESGERPGGDSVLDTLREVEESHEPFPDRPPLTYPETEHWQELNARRKERSSSTDLAARGPVEKKVEEALDEPTELVCVEESLQDVIDYLKDRHDIEIQLDKRALDDVGIASDRPVSKNLKGISLRAALKLALRDLDLTYVVDNGVLLITPTEEAVKRASAKGKQQPKTWRRARATPNASRLMIGDDRDLPLEGVQANVQIDGFRARVLLDYYFLNDAGGRYEGTFKLRLPEGASLYFFAFGETAYRSRPQQQPRGVRAAFLMASHTSTTGSLPEEILRLRADTWTAPKVARIVPKQKAAFAYRETVRRRVDPALVEWSGAGVFAARVFPLMPGKLHRIVVGYDVDLTPAGDDLEYQIDLPDVAECTVDVNLGTWEGGAANLEPEVRPFLSNGRAYYHFDNPPERTLRVRLENPGTVLVTGSDDETGDYFATAFRPELPEDTESAASPAAVFLLDTSLSSNPDRFNVWRKVLRAVLEENRGELTRFAVATFNVETHWWQKRFVENTPENVDALIDYAHTLALEGATDLGSALRQAARPDWYKAAKGQDERWDVFLLSDGAANWGEDNLHRMVGTLSGEESHAGAVFAYRTGMAGTATPVLEHLARGTGGAVFSVVGEAELDKVARAHRFRPWQLEAVELDGGRDLLVAGRPKSIFPGQRLILVGRGKPADNAPVLLRLRRGNRRQNLRVEIDRTVDSELAPRAYGQVAVGQLELVGDETYDASVSYARHFRVAERTCSLLMLDSEADYQRFDIKPEDDVLVVKTTAAGQLVAAALDKVQAILADPKAEFEAWLAKLEKMPGLGFQVSPALKLAVQSLPAEAFEVEPKPLACEHRTWDGMSGGLKEMLSQGHVDYDRVQSEARRRLSEHGPADALRAISSLVENSPGDLVLVRDVAFSALAWDLPGQAYPLFRRVAMARPYEPQMYLTMAESLADSGHDDLAILYYEVALRGTWNDRFQEFRRIATFEYYDFLHRVAEGGWNVHLREFAKTRAETIGREIDLKQADLVITMLWNTDATDVDLHVIEPTGEECFYQNRETKIGGRLTPDCTQGFGPEMYTLANARPGKYTIRANYYAADQNRAGNRSKVLATVYEGWGTKQQRRTRKALVLSTAKETNEIAVVGIGK